MLMCEVFPLPLFIYIFFIGSNHSKHRYRIELSNLMEVSPSNGTMKAQPLTTTQLKLVTWNISGISRGATGGDDADVLFDLVGNGTSGGRTFRFDSLIFHFRVVLHDNSGDLNNPPQPFPILYISLSAVNYTWVYPDTSDFLAFPFRFYLNSQQFLSPTMTADAASAEFGNTYFSVSSKTLTTTDGSPLIVKLWAVPWSSTITFASSIWVMYQGCQFIETSVCGVNHVDGITLGFTNLPSGIDKGYIVIIVITVIAVLVLVGLIGRYLVRKAHKHQTFYRLFSFVPALQKSMTNETELVPVRNRDLDD